MRLFITILILICTSLVGSVAYILNDSTLRERFFPTPLELVGKPAINDFEQREVSQVEITSADGTNASFTLQKAHWQADKPWGDRASNIAPIIAFAKFATVKETIPIDRASPSTFGFGEKSHHIILKINQGRSLLTSTLASPLLGTVHLEMKKKTSLASMYGIAP